MIKLLRKTTLILVLTLTVLASVMGRSFSLRQAQTVAGDYLMQINTRFDTRLSLNIPGGTSLSNPDAETMAYVFDLNPQGYLILSAYDCPNPLIGFSVVDNFPSMTDISEQPVYALIDGISHSLEQQVNQGQFNKPKGKDLNLDFITGPYITTLWGQVNCHNSQGQLVNVTNYYTPNNYAPGCVAISMCLTLNYYKWPPVGQGFHSYYDGFGSSTGWYEANFGETEYKWDLMLDKYNNQTFSFAQQEAVGELVFQSDVALEMDFEYNGSTSNVNRIPGAGSNYFRFYSFYKNESSTVFWTRLDKNVIEANPVVLAVEGSGNIGHSVVCDGLWINNDEERYYHLNMGWWGSGNGWFTIQNTFNAGGYSSIPGGTLDFIPEPYLHDVEIPFDTLMFNLQWEFTHTLVADAYEIQRRTNAGSWETISNNYQDTSLLIILDNNTDIHAFRVRAKVNNEWYPSSWSNTVQVGIITGIENNALSATGISTWPNPFTNHFQVRSESKLDLNTIHVFSLDGKQMRNLQITSSNGITQVETGQWASGTYVLELFIDNKKYSYKLLKK